MKRRFIVVAAGALGLAVLGGGIAAAIALWPSSPEPQKPRASTETAVVERGTLEGTTTIAGTLQFAGARQVVPVLSGTLTWLPAAGTTIRAGEPLYAVDNQRVFLLHGKTPAWRSFESGMSDGPDVQQLEQNLHDLGFFREAPDERFTWSTHEAIRAWQKARGIERTGAIDFGRVMFQPQDVRVGEVQAAIGAPSTPGAPVFSITNTVQQVQVAVGLSDQKVAVADAPVRIDLPAGATTTGKVQSVGIPTERDDAQGKKSMVVPVTIALDDPAAAASWQQASVTVNFAAEKREDVLSVPVAALLSLPDGGFGVEVVRANGTTKRVPVTTGLFAGSRVEITGVGEGDKVTVPES